MSEEKDLTYEEIVEILQRELTGIGEEDEYKDLDFNDWVCSK